MRLPRITRNILSNYILGGCTSLSTVILTALMFNRLGSEDYGLLSFAMAAVAVIEMLDLGLSSALVRFASRYLELQQWAEIKKLSTSIFFLLALVGCVLFFVIAGGIVAANYFRATPLPPSAKSVFLIFAATLPFQLSSAAVRAYLIGTHNFYLANIADGIVVLFRAAIVILLLMQGFGLVLVAIAFALFAVVRLCALILPAYRSSVPLRLNIADVDFSTVRSLARYTAGIFVEDITTGLFFQLDTLIAARVLPWTAVAILTVARRFPAMIVQFAHRTLAAVSPEFAGVWAREDRPALHRLVLRTTNLLMFAAFAGVTLFIWAEPILYHWIGAQAAQAAPTMRAFAIFGAAAALQELPVALFYSIGRVRLSSTVSACTTAAGAILGTVMAAKFGVFGLAVVWAGAQTLATIVLSVWAMRCIGLQFGRWLREGMAKGAASCAVVAVLWLVAEPFTHGELMKVVVAIAIGILGFLLAGIRTRFYAMRSES